MIIAEHLVLIQQYFKIQHSAYEITVCVIFTSAQCGTAVKGKVDYKETAKRFLNFPIMAWRAPRFFACLARETSSKANAVEIEASNCSLL